MVALRSGFPALEVPCCSSSSSAIPHQARRRRRRILPEISKQAGWCGRRSSGDKIYAISDIHTDYRDNMDWIKELSTRDFQRDALILAGDVSDNVQTFKVTLSLLKERFAHVFFVPGNHDLWCRGEDRDQMNSLEKLRLLNEICDSLCVETKPKKVCRAWIVPLLSWYHQSFDKEADITGYKIPSLEKSCVDYHACKWPIELTTTDTAIAAHFDELNSGHKCLTEIDHATDQVITFSHFLPRPELCPEKRMLFYPNLPKVIGSDLLETRLRIIHGSNGNPRACHVFGHTHFCWDATVDGIRYLQAPLAYPKERRRRINGGDSCLPLCIYDSEEGKGLLPGPLPCYWSDFYRNNEREPDNVVLAPWVAHLYHSSSREEDTR